MAAMLTILFLLASTTSLVIRGSSIAPKSVFRLVPTPDGNWEGFGQDSRGRSVKTVFLQKSESPVVAVTLATDGKHVLVKSEYNRHGHLVECDLIDRRADIDRFGDHVEESLQNSLIDPVDEWEDEKMIKPNFDHHEAFDVLSQVKACENLILKRDDEEESGRRTKRSYLIFPGTNWCGKGTKAEFASSYGPNKEADQCCQKHDQCPYMIEGFTTRYNLFNYRIHTLSHCDCDVPFMNCLKTANTTTSNMVGKVYFNVVNTECFELSLQKTCARRNWWGGCEKYTTKWTATVKTLGNYPEP